MRIKLEQGTKDRDRVFLSDPKEHQQVSSLLTSKRAYIEIKMFLATSTLFKAEEFMIISNIIKKFESCNSIPDSYLKLLSEVANKHTTLRSRETKSA